MTEWRSDLFRSRGPSEASNRKQPRGSAWSLKFPDEGAVLDQIRETPNLLTDAQIRPAERRYPGAPREAQHLRNSLLDEDLDFQLKLARLRQIRETLGRA